MAQLVSIIFLAACVTLVVSLDNLEVYDDLETFDDLEALDMLETRRNLETQDNSEARGNLDTFGKLETLDNLEVLDKRMLQERALQLENAEKFIDSKLEEFKGKLVEGFSGSDGKVSYKISNIKISDLTLDLNPQVKFVNGLSDAELTLTLPRFSVSADWWARYKSWLLRITRDGSLTATANRISVTVTVSLSPLKVKGCRSSADISVSVRGGGLVTKILLLFKKRSFVNQLEDKLEDAICDAINKL